MSPKSSRLRGTPSVSRPGLANRARRAEALWFGVVCSQTESRATSWGGGGAEIIRGIGQHARRDLSGQHDVDQRDEALPKRDRAAVQGGERLAGAVIGLAAAVVVRVVQSVLKNRGGGDVEFPTRDRLQPLDVGILSRHRDQAVDQVHHPSFAVVPPRDPTGIADQRRDHIGDPTTPDHRPGRRGCLRDGAAHHVQGGIAAGDCPGPGRNDAVEGRVDPLQHHLSEVQGGIGQGLEHRASALPVADAVACRAAAETGRGSFAQLQVSIEAIEVEGIDAQGDTGGQFAEGIGLLKQDVVA